MEWWTVPALAAGAYSAYFAAKHVGQSMLLAYDAVYRRRMVFQMDRLTIQEKANAIALKNWALLKPDERGRIGAITKPDGSIFNFDTGTVLDGDWNVVRADPTRERMEHLIRLLEARGGASGGDAQDLLPEAGPFLPEFVTPDQVTGGALSYRRLILGKTEHETVTADLADLVHIAVGGSSGWGKSVFLRWLVYQLIKSTDPVQLALIDLEGVTLAPFANSNRVLWPLADTEQDAIAVLSQVTGELDRRKEMYAQYAGVDSLNRYNEEAREDDKDSLVPIVTVVDEATALLENKRVEGNLRTLAQRARKYGLWLILAGQDWKGTSLDTTIRNQIGSRVHFHAMSSSQSRVLMGIAGAEELGVKGRAMIVRPGEEAAVMQTPFLKHSDIRGLRGGGPLHPLPVKEEESAWSKEQLREIWNSLPVKGRKSAMCRELGGEPEGHHFGVVRGLCKWADISWD